MAALYQLLAPTPVSFNGDVEGNWKIFKEEYEDYVIATEIDKKDAKIQVATLRKLMGPESRKRLAALALSVEELKDPKVILEKLTEEFTPTRNVLCDRHVFNKADQDSKEPIDDYVRRLRCLI
jgi:hypothetical protein